MEVISRDRAGAYAQAARLGAPQAEQVADRWHLFKNLGEALTTLLSRHRRVLKQVKLSAVPSPTIDIQTVATPTNRSPSCPRRYARFEQVRRLRDEGWTISAMARLTQLDRKTIRKYLNTERFPDWRDRRPRRRVSKLAPYQDYLLSHGLDGQRTVRQWWRHSQAQGFTGGLSLVATFMAAAHHEPLSAPNPTLALWKPRALRP